MGRKESKIQVRSYPSAGLLREFDGPLSLEERRLQNTFRNARGELCSGGENVEDEEGYRAVFTGQGASTFQMAAPKFLDTISKLLGQVTTTESARLSRSPEEECLEIWVRIPPRQKPNTWDKIDDPVVHVERTFTWSPIRRPSLGKNN